jgi:hypothetical protein
LRTIETAASAMTWIGCLATVSGGQQYSDSDVPSKDTTAMSSGQRKPASGTALSAPVHS